VSKTAPRTRQPSCSFEQLESLGVVRCQIDTAHVDLILRVFQSGSFGFGYSGPLALPLLGGGMAECQCSINIVVKHSKYPVVSQPS